MNIVILLKMITKSSYTPGPKWGVFGSRGGVRFYTGKGWLSKCKQSGWKSVLEALTQRAMAIGQSRANFAFEEHGNSEGRMGWAAREREETLWEREASLVFS